MNYKIGVIIPVYNVEKYIAECIESILAQTYTNFRLILVDDGTPDNAGKICDEYAKKDPRITVIHQENAGVTRARARGVKEANDCEFITFIDSDDTITTDALEHLVSFVSPDISIVLAKMLRYNNVIKGEKRKSISKKISAEQHRKNMIMGIDSGPTAKLIRRSLFTTNIFEIPRHIVMGEDTIANIRIAFENQQEVITTTKYIYYYRQHKESIMHTFNWAPEYEELFYQYTRSSIPKQEYDKYAKFVIISKIISFDCKFGYSTEKPKWIGSNYYYKLLNEIKTYNIRCLLIERLLITSTNYWLRKILIYIKRAKNKISSIT